MWAALSSTSFSRSIRLCFYIEDKKTQDYLACVASVSGGFGAKNKERESKTAEKMWQVRE